jgi:hypothetical protein
LQTKLSAGFPKPRGNRQIKAIKMEKSGGVVGVVRGGG